MTWLSRLIDRGVKRGVETGVQQAVDSFIASGKLDKIIDEAIAASPFMQFVLAMKNEMLRVDPKMSGKAAWDTAMRVYRDFLNDEKTKFGDPAFDWSKGGAVDLIHSYEIDHWEQVA